MFYEVDFRCDDREPLQARLNRLYDYAGDLETKVLHRSRLNLFTRLLEELGRRGLVARRECALDIGCNAGAYSKILSDAGFARVEGLDIEPWMVERANAEFGSDEPGRSIRFRVENAEEMDRSRKFDLILCTEVIEHTQHPGKVISNIREMVAPGGLAVVSLPNACSLPFAKAALKYRFQKRRDPVFEDHLRWPFWRSLRLFGDAGLTLVHSTGTNLWWDATTLRLLARSPLFPALNRTQFELARRWPLKFAAQFFFMVFRRKPD